MQRLESVGTGLQEEACTPHIKKVHVTKSQAARKFGQTSHKNLPIKPLQRQPTLKRERRLRNGRWVCYEHLRMGVDELEIVKVRE